jgi:hypothetical protein
MCLGATSGKEAVGRPRLLVKYLKQFARMAYNKEGGGEERGGGAGGGGGKGEGEEVQMN